jgi:formylglycine-generating enzyme required for sulfatase activity
VAGVIVIPRLRPTLRSDQRAGEAGKVEPNQPAVQADPPARLEEVEARDAPASLPSKPGVTDRVRITRPIDLAPPRPALPGEPPVIASKLGLKLALIPAGEFPMGSSDEDREAGDDEKARHLVRITRPFYLGVCEVSQREYEQVMGRNPSCYSPAGKMRDKVVSHDTWRYPVENVSWNDAIAFCNALSLREGFKPYYRFGAGARSGGEGYRLPTEAEWEYASRAGSTTRYGFGDDAKRLDESAWFDGNSSERTHPVGQKRPNAFGLFDMHGNVGEWCWDGYEARYDANPTVDDPVGPSRATLRVFRGGSWADIPRGTRSTSRYGRLPDYRSDDLGFRVARDAPGR